MERWVIILHSSFFIPSCFREYGYGVRGKGLGSRPVISKVSKAAVFDVFVARRCGFRYYWMQDVVPRCAIFAKLQNSLIQPRTSQKKFSLFENVSYFVFIVWRSTDRQFFYSPVEFAVDRFVATRGKLRVSEV